MGWLLRLFSPCAWQRYQFEQLQYQISQLSAQIENLQCQLLQSHQVLEMQIQGKFSKQEEAEEVDG